MVSIQIGCARTLPCSPGCVGGLAYNGCGFAAADPRSCGILRLDEGLCPIETVHTARRYTFLCYDDQTECYWAAADGDCSVIYRLDTCFREIECLKVNGSCRRKVCGMSCDPCCGTLWLLYSDAIAHVDTRTGAATCFLHTGRTRLNLGVVALCGGYMLSYLEDGKQYITVKCDSCGPCAEFCVPRETFLEGMALRSVCSEDETNCMTYGVELFMTERRTRSLTAAECTVSCCPGERPPQPCPCPGPPCPCPPTPCPPPTPPCHCGKYEIMHSVALEEAGIAHILNAEGEKLQKAVATSTSIEELLCINESVRRTITQITLLEGQLYSKLETLHGRCGGDPCDGDPDPCGPGNCNCC